MSPQPPFSQFCANYNNPALIVICAKSIKTGFLHSRSIQGFLFTQYLTDVNVSYVYNVCACTSKGNLKLIKVKKSKIDTILLIIMQAISMIETVIHMDLGYLPNFAQITISLGLL